MDFTSGHNCMDYDWKLNPNVQVKVSLRRLKILNDVQDHHGYVPENSESKSTPPPGRAKRKRISSSSLPAQIQTETSDPLLNSSNVMEELQKVVQEFEPECSICCKFVYQFSEHIRTIHSTSLLPSTPIRRSKRRNLGTSVEIEPEPNIPSFPQENTIPLLSLTAEYVKCEPGEIEIVDNDFLLHNVDPVNHHDNNTGSDLYSFENDDDIRDSVEGNDNDSHFTHESQFESEYTFEETIASPPTKQHSDRDELKDVGAAAVKPYKCDECETYFTRQDHMRRHLLRKHPGVLPYKCNVCLAGFKTRQRLTRHKKIHTREQLVKSVRTTSGILQKIQKTASNHTGTGRETCTIENVEKISPANGDLQTHSESESVPVSAQLEVSDGPLPNISGEPETNSDASGQRRSLRKRKSINYAELNEGPAQRNDILPSLTAKSDKLALPVDDNAHPLFNAGSESDEDHAGDLSDYNVGDSDSDFENTEEYKSTGKQYKCDKCEKSFTRLSDKRRHVLKIHPGVAAYECVECQAGFTSFVTLALHKKTHTLEKIIKIYKCKTCGKFYGSKSGLIEHSNVHKRKRTHKCQTCGRIFLSVIHLIQHSQHHTSIKTKNTHKCETCGKSFIKKCVLVMHKRLHTGTRPYKCEQCDKCFLSNGERIKHETNCTHCKLCDQRFADLSVLNVHMATHTGEKTATFKPKLKKWLKARTCEKCDVRFYTTMSLNRHSYRVHNIENPATKKRSDLKRRLLNQSRKIQTHTDKELHKCETCGKCFARKDWFIRHKRLHVRTYHYSFASDDTRAARITYKSHYERSKATCNICRVEFPTVIDLNAHVTSTHATSSVAKPYKCNICKSGFSTSAKIRKHFSQIHPKIHEPQKRIVNDSDSDSDMSSSSGYPYKCDHCSRPFEFLKHLENHMAFHTNEKPHKCETCEKSFYIKDVLINHQESHAEGYKRKRSELGKSSKSNYGCGFCSLKYSTTKLLTMHLKKVHASILPYEYVCKFCNEEFFSALKLNAHVDEVHPGKKPFQCTVCQKEFAKRYTLVLHSTIHKQERTVPCTHKGCTKMFKRKAALKRHLMIHSGAKPYKCEQCGKTFANSSGLYVHRKTHTGDKPFMCDKCSACFSRKGSLEIHMLSHKEEGGVKYKPHVCKDCGRGFTLKGQLTTHSLIHTGEKPHMCEECGVCFRLPHQLRAHLKTLAHAK